MPLVPSYLFRFDRITGDWAQECQVPSRDSIPGLGCNRFPRVGTGPPAERGSPYKGGVLAPTAMVVAVAGLSASDARELLLNAPVPLTESGAGVGFSCIVTLARPTSRQRRSMPRETANSVPGHFLRTGGGQLAR